MIILDGKKTSLEKVKALKEKVSKLSFKPKLSIVRVGQREDSTIYINKKIEYGDLIGIDTEVVSFRDSVEQEEVETKIKELNEDESISGIIVQLPLHEDLDSRAIINSINPKKDVDGLGQVNVTKLVNNELGTVPATPRGILTLLKSYDIDVAGKKVVVVGRSLLVGKSTALYLANHDATVTIAHQKTENLSEVTKQADILVVATGQQHMIDESYVHSDQVVIDVGISPMDETITGDVDFDSVKDKVKAISPVPGGVGPMTVVSLFENLLDNLE